MLCQNGTAQDPPPTPLAFLGASSDEDSLRRVLAESDFLLLSCPRRAETIGKLTHEIKRGGKRITIRVDGSREGITRICGKYASRCLCCLHIATQLDGWIAKVARACVHGVPHAAYAACGTHTAHLACT